MKKNRIINCIAIMFCVSTITGCYPWYGVKNQSSPIPDFTKYNTIYIGWIDLGKNEWRKYGYANINEWLYAIQSLNHDSLSYYVRQFEPKRTIVAPKKEFEKIPDNADLAIQFTNSKYYQYGNTDGTVMYMSEGIPARDDVLVTTIHFIDTKTNKELYRATITVEATISMNSFTYSLEGRINNASYNIARFISKNVLNKK